jgi:hypothetical protein
MSSLFFDKKIRELKWNNNLVKGKVLPCKVIIKYRATTTSWGEYVLEFADGEVDITIDVNKAINNTFWLTFVSLADENIKYSLVKKI